MTHSAHAKTETPWRVQDHYASLSFAGLCGSVNLAEPSSGVNCLSLFDRPLEGQILGLHCDRSAKRQWTLAECYERGHDLVAVYEESQDRPVRATTYWRTHGAPGLGAAAAIDLIVSVQTSLLNVVPELRTHSQLCAAEAVVFPLTGDRINLDVNRATILADSGTGEPNGCVKVRLAGIDATYCEMIHPSDWHGLQVSRRAEQAELRWSLVGHFMEKGVIRRLRVRGVFLRGDPEDRLIYDLYADFRAAPPPLTT